MEKQPSDSNQQSTANPNSPKDNSSRLSAAQSIREYHHKAIWEEEKHFTWLLSIILSAQYLVFTSSALENFLKLQFVIAISLLGMLFSFLAYRILHSEGNHFQRAYKLFVEEHNKVFTSTPLDLVTQPANKKLFQLLGGFFTGKLGVRDSFQFIFVIFFVVFAVILLLATKELRYLCLAECYQ